MDREHTAIVVEGIDIRARDVAHPINIVPGVDGTKLPDVLFVEWCEEIHLDHHATFRGLRHKVFQTAEIRFIPLREIELVPAIGVSRFTAARPGTNEASR